MLLDSGDIVLIADSQGVMDSYEATGTAIEAEAPVAVLVNKGTASASEVRFFPLQHKQKEKKITLLGIITRASRPRGSPSATQVASSGVVMSQCVAQAV